MAKHPTHAALFRSIKSRDERDQDRQDAAFDAQAAEMPDPCDCGGEWEPTRQDYNCDGDRMNQYQCNRCGELTTVCIPTRHSIPASAMGGRA